MHGEPAPNAGSHLSPVHPLGVRRITAQDAELTEDCAMTSSPAGIVVFKGLAEALQAGYQIYGPTPTGYLVRIRTPAGWAFALVDIAGDRRIRR
jgi:hypothetical protein